MEDTRIGSFRPWLFSLLISSILTVPVALVALMPSYSWVRTITAFRVFPTHARFTGVLLACLGFVTLVPLIHHCLVSLPRWLNSASRIRFPHELSFSIKGVALGFALIMLFWTPTAILMYPGASTGGDTVNQLYQYFATAPTLRGLTGEFIDSEFINDSPLLDTLVFGWFVSLGKNLGSDQLGFFLYCLTQMLLTAMLFSVAVCYAEKLGVPPVARLVVLLFVALLPMMPMAAFAMQKDSLFSMFLLLYCLLFVEIVRSDGNALHRPFMLVAFLIASMLCSLTKLTGSYTTLAVGLILVAALKGERLRAFALTIAPYAICAVLLPRIVFPALDVYTPQSGGGVPGSHILYQQVISVLRDESPETLLSEEELTSLERTIDVQKAIADYKPNITDGVSKCVKEGPFSRDSLSFLMIWFKLGITHPATYAKSVMKCCIGAYVPTFIFNQEVFVYQDAIDFYHTIAASKGTSFTLAVENPPYLSSLAVDWRSFLTGVLGVVPGFSLLLSYGFYGGWIPVLCIGFCLYYRRKSILGLTPNIVTSLLLMMIPVLFARYLIPSLYLCIPSILWTLGTAASSLDESVLDGVVSTHDD